MKGFTCADMTSKINLSSLQDEFIKPVAFVSRPVKVNVRPGQLRPIKTTQKAQVPLTLTLFQQQILEDISKHSE